MKRIASALLAWAKLFGAVALDKLIGTWFYWIHFPIVINQCGIVKGVARLLAVQLVFSIFFWWLYDLINRDLIGIVAIKERSSAFADRIRQRFGWHKHNLGWVGLVGRSFEFVILSWQLMPPLALLCIRKDGTKYHQVLELLMLMASTVIATTWWTLYSLGVLEALKAWFLMR